MRPSFKTAYTQMYLIPHEIYEKLLTCIDEGEKFQLDKINELKDQNNTKNQKLTSIPQAEEPPSDPAEIPEPEPIPDPEQIPNQEPEESEPKPYIEPDQIKNSEQSLNDIPIAELSPSPSITNLSDIESTQPETSNETVGTNEEEFPDWLEKDKKIHTLKKQLYECRQLLDPVTRKQHITKKLTPNPIRRSKRTKKPPQKYSPDNTEFENWIEPMDELTENAFACPACDATFNSRIAMKKHTTIHRVRPGNKRGDKKSKLFDNE